MNRLHALLLAAFLVFHIPCDAGEDAARDAESHTLISFPRDAAAEKKKWVTIDDSVFIGASKTRWSAPEDAPAKFYGNVSKKRGGGWCTVRRRPADAVDLSAFEGIELHILGDGKSYAFNLRTDDDRNGNYYEAAFATTAGEWQTVRLPFSSFASMRMGEPKSGVPALDLTQVRSYAFVIGYGQLGPYQLEIESIGTYGEGIADSAPSVHIGDDAAEKSSEESVDKRTTNEKAATDGGDVSAVQTPASKKSVE